MLYHFAILHDLILDLHNKLLDDKGRCTLQKSATDCLPKPLLGINKKFLEHMHTNYEAYVQHFKVSTKLCKLYTCYNITGSVIINTDMSQCRCWLSLCLRHIKGSCVLPHIYMPVTKN